MESVRLSGFELHVQSRSDERGRLACGGRLVVAVHGKVIGAPAEAPARYVQEGYEARGNAFLARLAGEFSFVLWDREARLLVAGRDTFGLKPLFYELGPDEVAVGTECRDIIGERREADMIDEASLLRVSRRGLLPLGTTVYRGIRRLPPSCASVFRPGASAPDLVELWAPRIASSGKADVGWAARRRHEETLRSLLVESVRDRMGGTAVGLSLSGGHDCAAILAATGPEDGIRPVHAVTLSFPGMSCDETEVARELANRLPPASWSRVDGFGCGNAEVMEATAAMCDRPGALTLAFATLLAGAARERGATTFFLGIGADETLTDMHFGADQALTHGRTVEFLEAWARTPADIPRLAAFVVRHGVAPIVRFGFDAAREGSEKSYFDDVWPSSAADETSVDAYFRAKRLWLLRWSIVWGAYENIEQVFSRHGIDVSFPFLDRRIVEFVLSLPAEELSRYRESKDLLRQSIAPWLDVGLLSPKGTILFGKVMSDVTSLAGAAWPALRSRLEGPGGRGRRRIGSPPRGAALDVVWCYLWMKARGLLEEVPPGEIA